MEGTGTSATAMLVATPSDVGGRPDAATVTLAREEIEEALASDEPLDLILTVDRDSGPPKDVRVSWERSDLETVLAGTDTGGITFSFDRAELYRAIEHPDFEGHGIREMVLITVAAASASAALAASTASAQLMEPGAGGGGAASVAAVQPGDPGTIPYLSHGVGVDQSQFSGTVDQLDPAIRTAMVAEAAAKAKAQASAAPGAIPYLSHGIGVDQSLFQGEQSLGLTGDSPITRVVGQEPAGATGDFVLRRSGAGTTGSQIYLADGASLDTGTDVNWTWVGFGAGMAALLAAAMGALYLSARHRDRVALP